MTNTLQHDYCKVVQVLHLNSGEHMKKQVLQKDNQLLYWLIAALLIISASLVDAALIAVVASLITVVQLLVIAFTVAVIDGGVFVTAWQMRRLA
jgi:hypothetical protein